jgi:hypothetical protein
MRSATCFRLSKIAVPPPALVVPIAPRIVSRSLVGPVIAPSVLVNGATMAVSCGLRYFSRRPAA